LFREEAAPARIAGNFRDIASADLDALRECLERTCFADRPGGFLCTDAGRDELADHLTGRLRFARNCVIPWLDSVRSLRGTRILEIGCGTGSSSVALAEQGAHVTAVDVDPRSLEVARARSRAHGLEASFVEANAADTAAIFADRPFEMVVHWSALEHMTHDERMSAMRGAWRILPDGGLWCIVDTPNRLWYFDSHSSLLPFFDWLGDELAVEYSRFSPRQALRELGQRDGQSAAARLSRIGRGISFHEFDLAIGPAHRLEVVSTLSRFRRRRSLAQRLKWRLSGDRGYERFLAKLSGTIDGGFFEQYLNLIIRKVT